MRLKQKLRIAIFALFISVIFSATAQDVKENLQNFSEIKTFNGVEVQVIPSGDNRIEITGHSKNEVKFGVVDDRLEIRLSLDHIWSKDNTRITVYSETIETIDANEASVVEVSGGLEGEEFNFRVQEGASIRAAVNCRRIVSKAITGGRITLEGKAEEQEVEANTGGHFYGRNLRTRKTVITSGTAGKGEIYATEYVKATARLGGTVEIFGRPKEIDQKTSLGGRIL